MYSVKLYQFTRGIQSYLLQNSIAARGVGSFKRSNLIPKIDQFCEVRDTYFHNRTKLPSSDWQAITELLIKKFKYINENNVDAVIVGICSNSDDLSLAKSYIKHLKELGKEPNGATLGKFLRTYNAAYHAKGGTNFSLEKAEQEEILEIYCNLRSKHDILDSSSCENLILGLVATEKWRDSLQLLEMMKISSNSPSSSAYTEIILKSFAINDLELGWQLIHEMVEHGKQQKCEIFLTLLNTIVEKNIKNFCKEIEKLFMFLEAHDILITETVANALQDIALKYPNLLVVGTSNLTDFGKCKSCGLHMKNISLSDEDFQMLKNSFLEKVLIRKDVFLKSTPEEVKQFCDHIERTGPFDCVIDGLNVAYSMGSKKPTAALANLLASVVKYFQNRNKHVLVLGRKHMNKWPRKTMQYIKDNAAVFLANDISEDDPFLLYATLKSGQYTDFFSRDFMRQHAYLLGPRLKQIFRRWQQEHQYSLVTQTESGRIIVKEPIRHMICANKVDDIWHVPYKKEFSPHGTDTFEKPKQWLCLKILK